MCVTMVITVVFDIGIRIPLYYSHLNVFVCPFPIITKMPLSWSFVKFGHWSGDCFSPYMRVKQVTGLKNFLFFFTVSCFLLIVICFGLLEVGMIVDVAYIGVFSVTGQMYSLLMTFFSLRGLF